MMAVEVSAEKARKRAFRADKNAKFARRKCPFLKDRRFFAPNFAKNEARAAVFAARASMFTA
jgi:hypothetical protein